MYFGQRLSTKKCSLPRTLKEASKEIVDEFLTMLAFEPVGEQIFIYFAYYYFIMHFYN